LASTSRPTGAPPCRAFTPKLAQTYKSTFQAEGLEIVFASSDKDEATWTDYYAEMPWLALPYSNRELKDALSKRYEVKGIPTLVILDSEGNLITTEGQEAITQDSAGTRFPWRTNGNAVNDSVKDYYSKQLTTSSDLQTNACKTAVPPPLHIQQALDCIHPEVLAKYYGCGLCLPEDLEGLSLLDLGCGAGRDVYIASQLVGKEGRVVGVDMTTEQLEVAKQHQQWHADKFGYGNVDFKLGNIEKLGELGLPDASFDVIFSNCVINLCADKEAVVREAYRLLKPGGELFFSDVYSDRRVPESLRKDPVLWGECISGALYWNDFHNLSKKCGFLDPRLVRDNRITIDNPKLEEKVGCIKFFSATYRLLKLDGLESHCEDYGQAVIYKGTVKRCPDSFLLDGHHEIETGKVFPVCGNTWRMLHDTRFKRHFDFIGNFDKHFGIYDGCGTSLPFSSAREGGSGGASSCC
jgi:SAM-dependent methyltransferase